MGRATQGSNALGERVDVILDVLGNLVKQLMQGDKVGAFDIPVGLFGWGR